MTRSASKDLSNTARVRQGAVNALSGSTARFAAGRVLPAAIAVLALPVLARALGPSEYGVLALATSAVTVAAAVGFGWAEIACVRWLSSPHASMESVLRDVASPLAVATVVVVTGATVSVVGFSTGVLGLLAGIATAVFGVSLVVAGAQRARNDGRGYTVTMVLATSSRYLVGVPAVLAGLGVAGVLGAWIAGGLIAVSLGLARIGVGRTGPFLSRPSATSLRFTLPAFAVTCGLVSVQLIDRLVIAIFDTDRAVGIYSLGYAVVEQTLVLLYAVLLTGKFTELVITYETEGVLAGGRAMEAAVAKFAILAGGMATVLCLYGSDIVSLIGGPEYHSSDLGFVPFVVLGVLIFGLAQYASIPLQLGNVASGWAVSVVAAAIVNFLLAIALVPTLGLTGAALATLIAYGAMLWGNLRAGSGIVAPYLRPRQFVIPGVASLVAVVPALVLEPSAGWQASMLATLALFTGAAWLLSRRWG